jgi:HD-like signal output (HDOD) protein
VSDKALNLAEQAFLHTVTKELEEGELRFPTSMEVTMRVLEALDVPDMEVSKISAMVSAEPLLAARTVALANSVWYNPSGRLVTDVPKALVRIGFGKLRALAMAVAAEQLLHRELLGPYQPLIRKLWAHSVDVAATACVLARRCTRLDPDAAFFAGMVHDIGQFFLLARVWEYPEMLSEESPLSDLVRIWHAPVGRAVLAAMNMPRELVDAVDNPEIYGGSWPPTTIPDLIFIANLLAETRNPFTPETETENLRHGLAKAATLGLDEAKLAEVLEESAEELKALTDIFRIG